MKLKVIPPLDPAFQPMSVCYREFTECAKAEGGNEITIAVTRSGEETSVFTTTIFKDGTGHDEENVAFCERLVKVLLWVKGGRKITVSGSRVVYEAIKEAYKKDGAREFDRAFMANVYEGDFEVEYSDVPPKANESSKAVGRHLDGCRIGFDAGGSDRKVSAVIDGQAVYSEEVVWFPKTNSDPSYHYEEIKKAMLTAASHMPRVDGIGVSSAGVYVDNKIMVASLFIKVSPEDYESKRVKYMYTDIAKEMGDIPIEVANDGDVTALAGAMSLGVDSVLGIAMGTSEAAGYVDGEGKLTGWLSELAFAPVDINKDAMVDEWSGDYGCGVKYFSQDGVIKLAPAAGIELDPSLSPAEKLKVVQKALADGNEGAEKIYESIGVYLGYAVALYALFYDIKHILLLGRVTSGRGGDLVLEQAERVLREEFPELASSIELHLPNEQSRRVGQSIAAASLPELR